MNSSAFMDKQIMDLMSPQEDHSNGGGGGTVMKKEEILPNYDFQPIRTVGSSSSTVSNDLDGVPRHSWGSADSKIGSSSVRYSNILEPHELPKINHENKRDTYDAATVSEVDRTVKKYADNLLHALEGVSTRLSQLESRTHHLENSVDELKTTVGNNSGSTDGKMRQLENILREVQTGVQVLRDKQEITEAQVQLTKLQQPSSKPPPETSNSISGQPDSLHHYQSPALPPYQPPQPQQPPPPYQPPPSQQPPPLPTPNVPPPQQPPPSYQPPPPQQPPPLPTPNAPPPPPPQQNQTPQYSPQLSQSLPRESSYFPQPQAQAPPQPQPYLQYSQPMLNPSSQLQPTLSHHLEESAPYMNPPPSHTYNPNNRQPSHLTQPPPASGPAQYYGPSSFSDGYPYSGSPSHYNSSMMKPSPFSNSPPTLGGGSGNNSGNYSRLPTAKVLPQAMPAATGVTSGGGSGAQLPIDDVVDKVATMGFSREQVRATVRKLTENGQSVDLNVVLDKLMNEGAEMNQPQKGWFGR